MSFRVADCVRFLFCLASHRGLSQSPYWFGSRHGFTRVWCRSFKATRKNAQNIPEKNPSHLLSAQETEWHFTLIYCDTWYLRLWQIHGCVYQQRDIFTIQTSHCSNSALANFVERVHSSAQYNLLLLTGAEQDFSMQWPVLQKTHIMASTGPP